MFLVFFDRFSWEMQSIMTTKLDIVTIFEFRTVILPKPGNVLYITYAFLSIRYLCKLLPIYALFNSQIGFVNYTNSIFVCNNILAMKPYLCVYFAIVGKTNRVCRSILVYILFGCLPMLHLLLYFILINTNTCILTCITFANMDVLI